MAVSGPGSHEALIEAVGGEGDGVAAGPVFVPFTLPGERVSWTKAEGGAHLVEVLEASPERQVPPCPHFGVCGGCALQHWREGPYLAWKVERLRQTLARERLETEILAPFASPPASRRRLALHARKGDRAAARLGYKMRRSWTLVEVAVCPIAEPALQAAIPALKRLAAPLFEHPKSAPTLHVTATLGGLDVDITGVERRSGGLSADRRQEIATRAGAAGMARVSLDGEILFQRERPRIAIGRAVVDLPPGAFLQAVPAAEAAMAAFAVASLAGAKRVADLYCGVGAFALRIAEQSAVHASDSAGPAVKALQAAVATAPGLKAVTTEERDLVRRPFTDLELKRFDGAVVDPPRAGALEQSRHIAASKLSRAVMVSCNPATFVRDARVLADAGFRLTRLLPVDQFLWSPHLELVAEFQR